jgi:DNA-3-methyladenine glycosylase I
LLWGLVEGAPIQNRWQRLSELPAETPASRAMSRELKRRGFRFAGPTICYALMQAVGMVNDHVQGCFRYHEVRALAVPPAGQARPGPEVAASNRA